ncbi:hypothetical protein HPC49_01355 [Pyxidicoccus fallax]|uniref:Lipoprotein n=1 Tax=Pyxidicoccus fallax TaxID=394095 RepID=A0A848LFR7_9BACT|nr:hypothetical protein [Pyxidicoccus fallax]NMO15201.1 hypothetical protein [Pyxidicoccus fallax]NPC76900.1 hypothetical protein [Pyxidicoccus fallax]
MRSSISRLGLPVFLLLLSPVRCATPSARDSAAKPLPAELQQQVEKALKGSDSTLSAEDCAALVGWTGPMENCTFTPVAGGKAALVQLKTGCGGDSCAVQVFVYRPGRPVTQLPDSVGDGSLTGGTLVLTPSLDHVITDWVGWGSGTGDRRVELYRVDLRTGEAASWVKDCFSPALSPGGRWILCRNRRGDVLKVPLTGGTPALVHRSGLSEEDVYWVPYGYVYPDAVTFPSPERIEVSTDVLGGPDGEEKRTLELPWRE